MQLTTVFGNKVSPLNAGSPPSPALQVCLYERQSLPGLDLLGRDFFNTKDPIQYASVDAGGPHSLAVDLRPVRGLQQAQEHPAGPSEP